MSRRAGGALPVDTGGLNREIVLENDAVVGSVNANLRHYALAADALAQADLDWLGRLVSRRVPLADFAERLRARGRRREGRADLRLTRLAMSPCLGDGLPSLTRNRPRGERMFDHRPAAAEMARLVNGVRDDQLGGPTPCPEYTLGDLLEHVHGLSLAFTMAARRRSCRRPTARRAAPRAGCPRDWRSSITERLDAPRRGLAAAGRVAGPAPRWPAST